MPRGGVGERDALSRRKHCDCTQRRAAAALDLHRQRDDERAARRELIEVGEVLEGGDVALVEDAVRFVERRLPVVDARRVDAERLDLARFGEPARRILMQARKVQLRDRRLTALRGAEIARRIRPELREAGRISTIAPAGIAPLRLLPGREVGGRSTGSRADSTRPAVTSTTTASPTRRSSGIWSTAQWSFAKCTGASRCVPPCSEVAEVVRRVVVALRRHAVGDFLQLERLGGRPENGVGAVVVRQIDERARRRRRSARGTGASNQERG